MFFVAPVKKAIELEVFASCREVEALWKELLPENHHLAGPDIRALEEAAPEDLSFSYVNIRRDGRVIGLMYLQSLQFSGKHYRSAFLEAPGFKPLKDCVRRQSLNLLTCGNLFRVNFQGFWFIDKNDRSLIFDCVQEFRRKHHAHKSHCAILVKDCSREFGPLQYSCHRYKAFNRDLTMEIKIRPEWAGFDEYLSALSRKYRQRALKIRRALEGVELRDLDLSALMQYRSEINALYRQVLGRQNLALGILNDHYFVSMKKGLGERFVVRGYFKDGQMLAFSSHIHYPLKNRMEIHYIGMDYAYNDTHQLYFNILFDGIALAARHAYHTLEMGRTAREAKASAGAYAVENFNYIWVKPGIASLAFRFLDKWFDKQMGDEWKKRNPFKTIPDKAETHHTAQNGDFPG